MKITALLLGTALAIASIGGAQAASFGPASGATVALGSPIVTLGALSGSESFDSPAAIFSTTGSLTSASGTGSVVGTLNFLDVPGTVLVESLPSFLTFADTTGGSFVFNVASVQTLSYSTSSMSTSFALYLLGTAGDSNLGLSPAPTSVTLTSNETGGSAYSASATISAPPSISSAPEPSTWALMIAGVFGIGVAFRQTKRRHSATVGRALSV